MPQKHKVSSSNLQLDAVINTEDIEKQVKNAFCLESHHYLSASDGLIIYDI